MILQIIGGSPPMKRTSCEGKTLAKHRGSTPYEKKKLSRIRPLQSMRGPPLMKRTRCQGNAKKMPYVIEQDGSVFSLSPVVIFDQLVSVTLLVLLLVIF